MRRMSSSRRMSRAVQVNMDDFGLIRGSGSLIIKGSQSFERVMRTNRQGERGRYGNRRLEGIESWKTLKVPPTECDYWWWYLVPWPLLPLSLPSVRHRLSSEPDCLWCLGASETDLHSEILGDKNLFPKVVDPPGVPPKVNSCHCCLWQSYPPHFHFPIRKPQKRDSDSMGLNRS